MIIQIIIFLVLIRIASIPAILIAERQGTPTKDPLRGWRKLIAIAAFFLALALLFYFF